MLRTLTVAKTLGLALTLSFIGGQAFAAGALAIDSNQGEQYGFAYDYPDLGQAGARALSECGAGCQVVLQFESGCGAYAADQSGGSTAYGWATDDSSSAAQQGALAQCQSQGGSSCTVRTWGCNAQ